MSSLFYYLLKPLIGGGGPPPPINTEAPFIQKDIPNIGFVSCTGTGSWDPEYNGFDPIEFEWYSDNFLVSTQGFYEYTTPIGADIYCKVRVKIGGVWSAWADSNHLII